MSGAETRTHMNILGPPSVARTVAVGACFGLRFLGPHVKAAPEARCIDGIARAGERARATRTGMVHRSAGWTPALRPGGVVFFVELAEFGGRFHWDVDCAAEEGVEGFDPEDLALENYSNVAGDGFGHCV